MLLLKSKKIFFDFFAVTTAATLLEWKKIQNDAIKKLKARESAKKIQKKLRTLALMTIFKPHIQKQPKQPKIMNVTTAFSLQEENNTNYALDVDILPPELNSLQSIDHNFVLDRQVTVNRKLSTCNARKRKRTPHRIVEDVCNKQRCALPSGSGLDACFSSVCDSTKLLPATVNQKLSACNARKRKRTHNRIVEDVGNKFAKVSNQQGCVLPSGSGLDAYFQSMCESTKLLPDWLQAQIMLKLSDAVTSAKICCTGLYGVRR